MSAGANTTKSWPPGPKSREREIPQWQGQVFYFTVHPGFPSPHPRGAH